MQFRYGFMPAPADPPGPAIMAAMLSRRHLLATPLATLLPA